MAIGLLEERLLTLAAAPGPGNLVVLYGSATGRDGIGGASVLASATFTDDDPSKRPSVQVGDPFAEKLLIEASLELIERGLVEGPPGPGRRRDHLRHLGDRGSGGDRDRRRPRCDPAPRTRPRTVRGHDLGVAGADVRRGPPRTLGGGPRGVRALGPPGRDHRAGHRRRRHHGRGRWPGPRWPSRAGRPGAGAHPGPCPDQRRDRPPSDRGRPDASPRCAGTRCPGRGQRSTPGARDGSRRGPPGPARFGEPRLAPRRLPPVRLDGRGGHGRRPGSRRGGPAGQGHDQGARGDDRRQCRRRGVRPVARRRPGGRRGDPQRVDHRGPATRRDELPQLRRPDPARGVLAAVGGRPRTGRRVPGARDPGHRRERLALQRIGDGADRADRGDRGRRAARRRRDPRRSGIRPCPRRDPRRRRGGARPRRLGLRRSRRERRGG